MRISTYLSLPYGVPYRSAGACAAAGTASDSTEITALVPVGAGTHLLTRFAGAARDSIQMMTRHTPAKLGRRGPRRSEKIVRRTRIDPLRRSALWSIRGPVCRSRSE
jgi:hypothetical protein